MLNGSTLCLTCRLIHTWNQRSALEQGVSFGHPYRHDVSRPRCHLPGTSGYPSLGAMNSLKNFTVFYVRGGTFDYRAYLRIKFSRQMRSAKTSATITRKTCLFCSTYAIHDFKHSEIIEQHFIMAPSKSTRIIILLAIDSAFFLLELIIGESQSGTDLALLLKAHLIMSQALPYTHWPSLLTPSIWSVIFRPFLATYHPRATPY